MVKLSNIYNIPVRKISEILKDTRRKEQKPKTFSDKMWVERYYKKNLVREKYLNGEHSRKKLTEELDVGIRSVDNWLADLPNLGNARRVTERNLQYLCFWCSSV